MRKIVKYQISNVKSEIVSLHSSAC